MRTTIALLILLALTACKDEKPEVVPMVAEPIAEPPKTPVAAPVVPAAPKVSVVTSRSGLYKTASKDSKIDDGSGKKVSNWITLLHRGERVEVAKTEGEWAQVKASDGSAGWIAASSILSGEGLTDATALEELQAFDRPDLVAVSKTKVEAGSLLFVLEKKDKFAQVNVRGSKALWVMSDKLSSSDEEVQVARLIERARYLVEKEKGEGAPQLVELAKTQFAAAKLLPVLQNVVTPGAAGAEKPAEEAPAAPKEEEAAKPAEPSEPTAVTQ